MSQSRWMTRGALAVTGGLVLALVSGCGGGDSGSAGPAGSGTAATSTSAHSSGSAGVSTKPGPASPVQVSDPVAQKLCDTLSPQLSDWRVQGPTLGRVALNISVHQWAAENGGINLAVLGDKAVVDRITTKTCSDVRTRRCRPWNCRTSPRESHSDAYPLSTPRARRDGMLDVGDGQRIYWEESAATRTASRWSSCTAGPGGGTDPSHRRSSIPPRYRIVLFDQRGCGRSTPHVADGASLEANTTWHLVADIERCVRHLGIDRWQVFGGSWGSTLALAYAETHPERVTELVLRGIFLLRRKEIDWYYNGGAAIVYPDEWEKYLAPIPAAERDGDLVAAYHRLLHSPDPDGAPTAAAVAWSSWEGATSSLLPHPDRVADDRGPRFALAFARIENHYFVHGGFLGRGPVAARYRSHRRYSGRDRAGPPRHRLPGGQRVGSASGVAEFAAAHGFRRRSRRR